MNKLAFPYPFWVSNNTQVYNYSWEEKDGVLYININLPGVTKEEIELTHTQEDWQNVLNVKIPSKDIDKDIRIDRRIDPDKIESELNLGVLKITVPLVNVSRKIAIKG